jgi:16S rRNA (uracil1498-N3)-methyltransferase
MPPLPSISSRICPVRILDKTVHDRLERWCKIATETSRVAGRAYLPEIKKACSWTELLEELEAIEVVVMADETGGARPGAALSGEDPVEVGLVIGPEGGFSEAERRDLLEKGARPVTLGETVLRTETAGMVLMAAVRCHLGML